MAQKRYGPTRGAGTVVIELEGQKSIEPGALGMAGYAGVFEKGDVGELIVITNKTRFLRQMGSYIEDGLTPDACIDYFDAAAGAGGLLLIRITDGNELQASRTLYQRNGNLLVPMGTVKAKNGGRWGGKEQRYTADMTTGTSPELTDTTLDTGSSAFTTDQWKDGWIEFDELPNKRYPIVGNDDAGVITVAADQKMLTEYTASGGGDLRYYLVLENEAKALSVQIEDGEEFPSTEFALSVYVDGAFVKKYGNLSTDPTADRYWVNIINNDGNNFEIEAVDLVVGAHTAATRPADHYGLIDTVTATVLTAIPYDVTISSPGGADPTFSLDAADDEMIAQTITVAIGAASAMTVSSDKFGALGTGTVGVAFVPNNKWTPEFTITDGVTALADGDSVVINYKPFKADSLVGGYVWPDKANAATTKFRIIANDYDSITVQTGSDLTTDGAPGDEFMVSAPLELEGGRDGNADLVDADYISQGWDVSLSPFNRVVGRNLGLIKYATPGITATAVAKAGAAYALAKNHQYRHEIPANITTEQGAIDHINDTIGRTEYSVGAFPTYVSVPDPEAVEPGRLKQVTNTGMIHGVEAAFSRNYNGYHKAAAGIDAILSKILDVPTGEAVLDEELLNPAGLQVIKKIKGNYIIWGDRTLHLDPTWRWKHQREQMSYYEHVLQENFDWIIFAINDPVTQNLARAALHSFFFPEWTKRALRGDTFDDAASIKIDAENNTDATRAAGDMYADIALRLADTVERFIVRIGKQGIFEG